jgi:hypothetical protein
MADTQKRTAPLHRPGSVAAPTRFQPRRNDWVVDTATGFAGRFQGVTAAKAYRPSGGGHRGPERAPKTPVPFRGGSANGPTITSPGGSK